MEGTSQFNSGMFRTVQILDIEQFITNVLLYLQHHNKLWEEMALFWIVLVEVFLKQ